MSQDRWLARVMGCAMALPGIALAQDKTPDYAPVTQARLLKPEAQNWLMIRGGYSGNGYKCVRPDQY